jgi:diaminopimelate decarboxylase
MLRLEIGALPTDILAVWRTVAERAVGQYRTPCYITWQRPIEDALQALERETGKVRSWLSFKTHPLPELIRWWNDSGRGVEVVSEFEFAAARRLGCTADNLLVNGLAKHTWLPRHPVRRLRVHFDSLREVESLLPQALQWEWRVGVRVHAPDERDARDERFGGQFGMTAAEAVAALGLLREAGADVQSMHFHLGQRPQAANAYIRAVEHLLRICDTAAFRPRFVDCGGGLPGRRTSEDRLAGLRAAIRLIEARFQPELEQVWLENGRFLSEESTMLAVRVLDAKDRPEGRYLICDGGRTNHALAADHGPHPILVMPERSGATRLTTICGPTCMTDDVLARIHLPEEVGPGDVLLWMNAGAYHLPWETRFSQGLCAVAWCNDAGMLSLARGRERPDDWMQSWTL